MGFWTDLSYLFEQYPYMAIIVVGYFVSILIFLISGVSINIIDYKFKSYIGKHDQQLWLQYNDFKPKQWGRILQFIRIMPDSEDDKIRKMQRKIFIYERIASIAILISVIIFTSMIIMTIILDNKQ